MLSKASRKGLIDSGHELNYSLLLQKRSHLYPLMKSIALRLEI
jgi:hypothetical protein